MIKTYAQQLEYPIPKQLKPFVVGVLHGESDGPVDVTVPVFPTGYPLIVYVYGDIPVFHVGKELQVPPSRLCHAGQVYNVEIESTIKGTYGQIGLILNPTASYYLFHRSGVFFLNRWLSLEAVSPIAMPVLTKKILTGSPPVERLIPLFSFMESLVKNRLPPIPWLDEAVENMYKHNGNVAQNKIIQHLGISGRHFRRKFKEVIGVPPKYFCKVIQLVTIFEMIKNPDSGKLHDLALECGYYDQAHFINDFNKMIGQSPQKFLKGKHTFVRSYLGRRD